MTSVEVGPNRTTSTPGSEEYEILPIHPDDVSIHSNSSEGDADDDDDNHSTVSASSVTDRYLSNISESKEPDQRSSSKPLPRKLTEDKLSFLKKASVDALDTPDEKVEPRKLEENKISMFRKAVGAVVENNKLDRSLTRTAPVRRYSEAFLKRTSTFSGSKMASVAEAAMANKEKPRRLSEAKLAAFSKSTNNLRSSSESNYFASAEKRLSLPNTIREERGRPFVVIQPSKDVEKLPAHLKNNLLRISTQLTLNTSRSRRDFNASSRGSKGSPREAAFSHLDPSGLPPVTALHFSLKSLLLPGYLSLQAFAELSSGNLDFRPSRHFGTLAPNTSEGGLDPHEEEEEDAEEGYEEEHISPAFLLATNVSLPDFVFALETEYKDHLGHSQFQLYSLHRKPMGKSPKKSVAGEEKSIMDFPTTFLQPVQSKQPLVSLVEAEEFIRSNDRFQGFTPLHPFIYVTRPLYSDQLGWEYCELLDSDADEGHSSVKDLAEKFEHAAHDLPEISRSSSVDSDRRSPAGLTAVSAGKSAEVVETAGKDVQHRSVRRRLWVTSILQPCKPQELVLSSVSIDEEEKRRISREEAALEALSRAMREYSRPVMLTGALSWYNDRRTKHSESLPDSARGDEDEIIEGVDLENVDINARGRHELSESHKWEELLVELNHESLYLCREEIPDDDDMKMDDSFTSRNVSVIGCTTSIIDAKRSILEIRFPPQPTTPNLPFSPLVVPASELTQLSASYFTFCSKTMKLRPADKPTRLVLRCHDIAECRRWVAALRYQSAILLPNLDFSSLYTTAELYQWRGLDSNHTPTRTQSDFNMELHAQQAEQHRRIQEQQRQLQERYEERRRQDLLQRKATVEKLVALREGEANPSSSSENGTSRSSPSHSDGKVLKRKSTSPGPLALQAEARLAKLEAKKAESTAPAACCIVS